jgi:HSP20 family protein
MFDSLLSYPGSLFTEFDRLRRELDDVFGVAGLPTSIRSAAPGAFPAINIGSAPASVEIYAFAPGIDPGKIEVTLDRGVMTIAGDRPSAVPGDEAGVSVYSNERFAGRFRRAISLPDDLDPDRIEAKYLDGVLHISIRRRESAVPKRISVQ